jgi:hypothetical protein
MELYVMFGIEGKPKMDTEHDFEVCDYLVDHYLIDLTSIK